MLFFKNQLNNDIESDPIITAAHANPPTKDNLGHKFTASNFTETVVVNADSVFGGDSRAVTQSVSNVPLVKKRKLESGKSSNSNSDEISR